MAVRTKTRRSESRVNHSFLQGALILTIGMAVVKLIGALFKIPLASILGTTGMGYFTAAYDLYNPLFTLATAGFPVAIARMVSESVTRKRFRDVRKIHRVSIPTFALLGVVGFLLMMIGSTFYADFVSSPGVKYPIWVLAPTILFACLMSIYRGYYEGMRNMTPIAVSEIIEAVSKLIVGLTASYVVIQVGMSQYAATQTVFGIACESEEAASNAVLPFAAAGAILGITVGSVFGFLFLFLRYKKRGDGITRQELMTSPRPKSNRATVRALIRIAIPVALGALVINIATFIDSALIQRRIADIMGSQPDVLLSLYPEVITPDKVDKAQTTLYGCYSMAMTLMMLIPAITQVFGISALPSVTAAWTEGSRRKIKKSIESVLRITTLITIPAGLGIAVMAHPIAELLYLKSDNQADITVVGNVLSLLGFAGIFVAINAPICSMLQAIGRVDLPVKLMSIGVIIKIVLNYTMVGIPEINIQGAGTGTLVCYAFISISALYFLCKETRILPNFISVFIKPLIASGLCAASAYVSYSLLSKFVFGGRISTIISLCIAVLVYVIALFCLRAITKDDVMMLPKGQKIAKILEKHRWIG